MFIHFDTLCSVLSVLDILMFCHNHFKLRWYCNRFDDSNNVLSFAVQPNITITGLDKSSHKENDTLTVACMIDRLYPQIQPANFTMRWGNTVTPTVDRNNTDGSFSYRAELTKILTKEDNGMIVTCNVSPVRGTPVSEQRTLNVQCEYLDISVREATYLIEPDCFIFHIIMTRT